MSATDDRRRQWRDYKRRWREANPEREREYQRRYREVNWLEKARDNERRFFVGGMYCGMVGFTKAEIRAMLSE